MRVSMYLYVYSGYRRVACQSEQPLSARVLQRGLQPHNYSPADAHIQRPSQRVLGPQPAGKGLGV